MIGEQQKSTVLVTGGAGYIGSHTILALCERGHDVVVIDNLSTGHRQLVDPSIPLIVGDIADQELVSGVLTEHKCDAVLHFAGSIIAPESLVDPLKYYVNNTENSRKLIECCVDSDVNTLVFSSSAAVYGNPPANPVSEDAATAPLNPYGSSKLMTERMLRDVAAATNLRYAALRYFNVAGADPMGRTGQMGPNSTHLIRVASELALGKRSNMSIFGVDYDTPDGTCIRDYIHVTDLADAHVHALDHLLRSRQSFTVNCGYGRGYSVREVIAAVQEKCDHPLDIRVAGRRSGDAAAVVADPARIRALLPWTPRHDDLEQIVASTLAWERAIATRD